MGVLRAFLVARRSGLREALLYAAAALGTLAANFALVAIDFEAGHIAGTVLAAIVGAVILAASGYLGSFGLSVAGYYWLGVVLAVALLYDADQFSAGGWSVLAAGAALLGGAYLHRLLVPGSTAQDAVFGGAAVIAAVSIVLGIDELTEDATVVGLALLAPAAVYVALAAWVFRRTGFRDVATVLWSLGLLFVLGAEVMLIGDGDLTAAVVALTGGAVAVLSLAVREWRLWLAGTVVAGAATVATLVLITPLSHFFEASESPAEGLWVLLACVEPSSPSPSAPRRSTASRSGRSPGQSRCTPSRSGSSTSRSTSPPPRPSRPTSSGATPPSAFSGR